MINTSDTWKENQKKSFVNESYVEIILKLGNPEALADAVASDNGHEFFSDVESVTSVADKEPIKYATLEPYLWLLDGSYRILGMEDYIPEPPPIVYYGFVPDGDDETMVTFDSMKFYVLA